LVLPEGTGGVRADEGNILLIARLLNASLRHNSPTNIRARTKQTILFPEVKARTQKETLFDISDIQGLRSGSIRQTGLEKASSRWLKLHVKKQLQSAVDVRGPKLPNTFVNTSTP
jgi:Ribonuclease G/E